MYQIKQDPRIIHSSQMLYEALGELVREKPFSKISVTDLVETAQVGRTTFYRLFDEIEDVLQMRCNQVLDELLAHIIAYRGDKSRLERFNILRPILHYFHQDSEIIDLLLRAKRIDILQDVFYERTARFYIKAAKQLQISDEYAAYVAKVRIGSMIITLTHWVETGKQEAPDELADRLTSLMKNVGTIDQLL